MNILIIGSGGREHAIALALANSKSNPRLFAAPGNPGIALLAESVDLNLASHSEIIDFCKKFNIDFVFVGPEQPLADGLADSLRNYAIPVFGPSQNAARLESSKDFAKNFMAKYNIPTAAFFSFSADQIDDAKKYVSDGNFPVVLKADGLAAGKGVIIAESENDAHQAIDFIFDGAFGSAGSKLVIEEFMQGEEASIFAISDGHDFVTLAPSQDHKRVGNDDLGKNTGGMGAYAPTKIVTEDLLNQVKNEIIIPTLQGMASEGYPFIGCLYVGLMIKDNYAKVVEFNCRFGDPETQAVLSIFDGDFAQLCYSAAIGSLDISSINNIAAKTACCVVLASDGYPDAFDKGFEIKGLDNPLNSAFVYHAGTKAINEKIVSSGGRVLGVTGLGTNLAEAINNAYIACEQINFDNKYYRVDIGKKGLKY